MTADSTWARARGADEALSIPVRFAVLVIVVYQQAWSSRRSPACRYLPSCSSYALTAIQRFGIWKGVGLALRRILRCHPWHVGGYDPVPHKPPADARQPAAELSAAVCSREAV